MSCCCFVMNFPFSQCMYTFTLISFEYSRILGSAQKKFQTPANRTLADAGWSNTPLVTPKFDPR